MASKEQDRTPVGSGHAAAMGRLGLQELRNAFYNGSNIAQQQSEYGLYGKATPGEVAASRQGEARDFEEERGSSITEAMDRAAERESAERGAEREDPERKEIDREP